MAPFPWKTWLARINVIDFTAVGLIVLVVLGIISVQSGWHQTAGQQINDETDIQYTVFLRDIKTPDIHQLFTVGEPVSLTIRNQPRGKIKLIHLESQARQVVLQKFNGPYELIPDPTEPTGHHVHLTFLDHALVTADGYVANGLKVKTGMRVTVEGFDFQFPGVITHIDAVSSNPSS